MYPLKFQPIYKEVLWGGTQIATRFGRDTKQCQNIGESWDLCQNQQGISIVSNGFLAGRNLAELMADYKKEIFGSRTKIGEVFPLMIKYLDAADNLSVQVHPGHEYAQVREGEAGKNEAWYIVEAKEGAQIVYGLKTGVNSEQLQRTLRTGCIADTLNIIPVKAGELYYIPAGMVHALMGGVMVCEVQQNSNVTYRLYDYERLDQNGRQRELHLDKALEVIDFNLDAKVKQPQASIDCPYFSLQPRRVSGAMKLCLADHFYILCILKGYGTIIWNEGAESVKAGETILLPACLGDVLVSGQLEFLQVR